MKTSATIFLAVFGIAVASFTLGVGVATPAQDPDWTIALCELWATDAQPVLPEYTIQNVCITDIGTLSYAD